MNIEILRDYCLSKDDAEETFPFGDDTLVFKKDGKIFALANLDGEPTVNLKCDPGYALELRDRYSCVIPGYHMNKNTGIPSCSTGLFPISSFLNGSIIHSTWYQGKNIPPKASGQVSYYSSSFNNSDDNHPGFQ
jgi:predicted DNA-binding protein (MmcQ/YjbR family)